MTKTDFLPFPMAKNLRDEELSEGAPWAFSPEATSLADMRHCPKEARKVRLAQASTDWNVYSAVAGVNPSLRVSAENRAAQVRGLVADYDTKMDVSTVEGILNQMPAAFRPNFIEVSLGMKIRLVWVFKKPLPVTGSPHAQAVYQTFAGKFKIPTLLPGFDEASEKPTQVWTNGGEWYETCERPLPWELVFGLAVDAAKKVVPARADVPIEKVAEEVEKRWPGRWQGEFKLDALGVRFWDATADCQTGCQVKPDGMLCFTGRVAFMRWEQLFGAAWVHEQSALNLSAIAEGIYFDGRAYHYRDGGHWFDRNREDTLLELSKKGLDTQKRSGQTISEAHRVLSHIQTVNRVHGSAPLIYHPPGIVEVAGQRILNTSTSRLIEPSARPSTPDDFPLIWKLESGLFLPRQGMFPTETARAWLRRSCIALRNHQSMMGQAIFLCGPPDNGKTLWCIRIVAALLGGRYANPYRYLTGDTDFNDELFGAAVWAINDEESPDEKRKSTMLAKLKAATVNPDQTFHPKFCKKLSLPWQGRIVVTTNDDPHSVSMLPEINDATRDKLMLFATQKFDGIFPERPVLEAQIARELPFYLRWLLDWQPPDEVLQAGRMGVKSYFDLRLLSLSSQQSAFYGLRELLMLFAEFSPEFNGDKPLWKGNPTRLLASLSTVDPLAPLLRDWSVYKIAKALNSLARVGGLGVAFAPGSNERDFTIDRRILLADETTNAK